MGHTNTIYILIKMGWEGIEHILYLLCDLDISRRDENSSEIVGWTLSAKHLECPSFTYKIMHDPREFDYVIRGDIILVLG